MKFYDFGITIFLILIAASIVGAISIKYLGPENPIEEASEAIIEVETGKKIDLSTGEKDAVNQK